MGPLFFKSNMLKRLLQGLSLEYIQELSLEYKHKISLTISFAKIQMKFGQVPCGRGVGVIK